MKIGVCININNDADFSHLDEKFREVRDGGFDNCQVISWTPSMWTEENALAIKNAADAYDVKISGFWCGWEGPCVWNFYEGQKTLGLIPPEYREMRIKNLCDGGDFAKKMNVTDVITHMGFIPENPYDENFEPFCEAVRKVSMHLKENNQYLLFETGQETPVTLMRCFETVGTDNLGVNLDTANLILYGKANPVDALDVIGKYVRNIHAKDGLYPTNGHDIGQEVRIGDGKVDFYGLVKKLKELEYHYYITIEREIDGEEQKKDIEYARDFLDKIIKEIYGV